MAITRFPEEIGVHFSICAICDVALTPERATAGLIDVSNQQRFACVSHLYEVEKLIVGWADFVMLERQNYLKRGQEPTGLIYGVV